MQNAMRYEWIRLTTTRGFLVLAATAVLGSALVSWAMTLMIVNVAPELTTESSIEAATLAAPGRRSCFWQQACSVPSPSARTDVTGRRSMPSWQLPTGKSCSRPRRSPRCWSLQHGQ